MYVMQPPLVEHHMLLQVISQSFHSRKNIPALKLRVENYFVLVDFYCSFSVYTQLKF